MKRSVQNVVGKQFLLWIIIGYCGWCGVYLLMEMHPQTSSTSPEVSSEGSTAPQQNRKDKTENDSTQEDWANRVRTIAPTRPPEPRIDAISFLNNLNSFVEKIESQSQDLRSLGYRGENGDTSMLLNGFLQLFWVRDSWR